MFVAFLCIAVAALLYGAIKGSQPKAPILPFVPTSTLQEITRKVNRVEVESYIRENITNLSDEKAVLGGTFYVTEIIWEDDFHGAVFYEDGHYAFKRMFTVTLDGSRGFFVTFDMIVPE